MRHDSWLAISLPYGFSLPGLISFSVRAVEADCRRGITLDCLRLTESPDGRAGSASGALLSSVRIINRQ